MKLRDVINTLPLGSAVIARRTKREHVQQFLREARPVTTSLPLIRIGSEGDGGYLVPDDFAGVDACFSPGVARQSDFESALASKGIPCFMADYSVDGPALANPLFHFEKRFLGPINDREFMTLGDWVNRNAPAAREMILQMDIEGAEFEVLLESESSLLRRFRIIVIEFHDLHDLWQKRGYQLIRSTFLKLLNDFAIVHVHPNNKALPFKREGIEIPPLMEYTFLRKDRVRSANFTKSFPHPLDRANTTEEPDFPVPRCWFESA